MRVRRVLRFYRFSYKTKRLLSKMNGINILWGIYIGPVSNSMLSEQQLRSTLKYFVAALFDEAKNLIALIHDWSSVVLK